MVSRPPRDYARDLTPTASAEEVTDEDLQAEQQALLEAKARYALKKSIAESIMVANPILKAVHAGSNASPIERFACLRPRDVLCQTD